MVKRSSMSMAVLPSTGTTTKPGREVTKAAITKPSQDPDDDPSSDTPMPMRTTAMRSMSMPAARHALPSMLPMPAAPMPPCAAEIDQDLMDSMEQLFADGNAIVLVAFEVLRIKQSEDTTGTQLLKALGAKSFLAGRHAPAPRVLCFTLRRAKAGEKGFKPYLTLVKPVDAYHYKVKHSYPLKLLEEIKLAPGKIDFGGMRLQVLELTLGAGAAGKPGGVSGGVSADKAGHGLPAFGVADPEQLNALLAVATQLLKQAELPLPKLSGLEAPTIAKWWAANGPGLVARLGEFSAEVLTGSQAGGAEDPANTRVLVSAKEEKDLEDLLDMYAMGLGDVGEFEARLMDEHEALEAANIHGLLSNVPMVDSVVFQLKRTAQMLEDVDETLQVFGVKLRHMRQDIGAIEQYNNTLELTARNNAKLMAALKSLLSELRIPSEMRNSLEDPPFDKERLTAVLKPGWALVSKLSRLQPGTPTSLNPHLLQMRVVREAREDMTALAKVFVTRAAAHLSAKITQVVEELALEVGKSTDKASRTKPADHERLQALRKQHADLMRLVRSLDPATLGVLRDTYTHNTNMLLRKECRAASAELRKAAALDAHHYPIDFGLTKDTAAKAVGGAGGGMGGSDAASLISDLDTIPHKGPGSSVSKQSRSSIHMLLRPRASNPLDGTSLSMPLNEAWTALLDTWLPVLLEELQAASTFLLLYVEKGYGKPANATGDNTSGGLSRGPTMNRGQTLSRGSSMSRAHAAAPLLVEEARHILYQLIAGLEPEFQVLVDAASKGGQQFLGLPMMAQTTWWLTQLLPSPEATPLVLSLSACHARLRAQVSSYRATQLQLIEAYASKASGGVKSLHVLAFTFQFSLLIHHLEQVMAAEPGIQELLKAQEGHANKFQTLPMWLDDPSTQPPTANLPTDSIQSKGGKLQATQPTGSEDQHQSVKAALTWQCRLEVDEVYTSLVGCMFSVLERMAVMDAKHGQRLRLENYTYFAESVRPLLRLVSALQPYLQQAEDRREESLASYVQQQLEYSTIWKALDFSAKIDKLLEVVNPTEIPFQAGCSAGEARALITAATKDPAKQLAAVAARVRKHLGASTLALRVWERTSEELLSRYERLEAQLQECYPQSAGLTLTPSPDQLADLLQGMGQGA